MRFVYQERTLLVADRSNIKEVNDLINELLVKLQKLCPNAKIQEFQADKDHAYSIIDLPFEG